MHARRLLSSQGADRPARDRRTVSPGLRERFVRTPWDTRDRGLDPACRGRVTLGGLGSRRGGSAEAGWDGRRGCGHGGDGRARGEQIRQTCTSPWRSCLLWETRGAGWTRGEMGCRDEHCLQESVCCCLSPPGSAVGEKWCLAAGQAGREPRTDPPGGVFPQTGRGPKQPTAGVCKTLWIPRRLQQNVWEPRPHGGGTDCTRGGPVWPRSQAPLPGTTAPLESGHPHPPPAAWSLPGCHDHLESPASQKVESRAGVRTVCGCHQHRLVYHKGGCWSNPCLLFQARFWVSSPCPENGLRSGGRESDQ